MSLVASLQMVLSLPHPAGRPFIIGGAVAVVAGAVFAPWLVWLGAAFMQATRVRLA